MPDIKIKVPAKSKGYIFLIILNIVILALGIILAVRLVHIL